VGVDGTPNNNLTPSRVPASQASALGVRPFFKGLLEFDFYFKEFL
jgi:hypothetical protein